MRHPARVAAAAALIALTGLAACTEPERPWTRPGAPQAEVDRALAECKYQSQLATATVGTAARPKTFGDAVSEGVAAGVVRGIEENDLVKSCMESRGFRRQ